MPVNDIYEVTDVQELQGQQVLNVYFYEQRGAFVPSSGSVAQALADEWSETVLPTILAVQSPDLLHVETRVRNLFSPLDQGTTITALAGTLDATGDTLPSFAAFGIGLTHDNAAIRPGAKRIAGVDEGSNVDGVPGVGMIVALNEMGDAMAAPITGGLIITDDIMFPVVVQRVREGAPGSYTYRLPESSGEATVGTIIEALVKLFITSQISRKVGIGL